jgi:hypothetical protein
VIDPSPCKVLRGSCLAEMALMLGVELTAGVRGGCECRLGHALVGWPLSPQLYYFLLVGVHVAFWVACGLCRF